MNAKTQNLTVLVEFHKNGEMTSFAEKIYFAKKLYES